jgi:hypothetical protein
MGHTPDQHVEHAEHAGHHAQDPFNKRVAMTIAILAAGLAGVTLLSHRGHTETLSLLAEANSIQTEAAALQTKANIYHTRESDQWAFYQAKNIRSYEFQAYLKLMTFLAKEPGTEKAQEEARQYWAKQVDKYEGKRDKDGKRAGELAQIRQQAEQLQATAERYQQEAEDTLKKAKAKKGESHHIHTSVNWIDSGHLAIELALILCSVAVLTKERSFWFSGGAVAVVGAGLAGFGLVRWLFLDGSPH